MNPFRAILCLATIALTTVSTAFALELDGVKLPDSVTAGQSSLTLNGAGTRRATIFRVRVYVAGLYLERKSGSAEEILASTGTKQLTMRFARAVDADDISDAWKRGFEENNPKTAPLLTKLSYLTNGLGDMEVGSSMTLTFSAQGVTLQAGRLTNTVNDPNFATAVLRIWLGTNPPDEGLKAGLLGKN